MTDGEFGLTDDELALGGLRFEDLQALRIVENRTDLNRKQNDLGFPRPVKTGKSQALFLKAEVFAWLRQRAALRDAQVKSPTSIEVTNPATPVSKLSTVRRAGGRSRATKLEA